MQHERAEFCFANQSQEYLVQMMNIGRPSHLRLAIFGLAYVLLIAFANPGAAQTLKEAKELFDRSTKLYEAGKYSDALPLAQQVLTIKERLLGPDHTDVGQSLLDLATLFEGMGRYSEAVPLQERALKIFEKASDDLAVAAIANDLAGSYKRLNRLEDAEALDNRAIEILRRELGPNHPEIAMSLNNLAEVYREQGRYAEAEDSYKRALAIAEKAFGPVDERVAQVLTNLAVINVIQGRPADAEPLAQRPLTIWERAVGPDHPKVADTLLAIASILEERGRFRDAEPLYRRALSIEEKTFGPNHPDVAIVLSRLSALYWRGRLGRLADAEQLQRRAIGIFESSLGPNHPAVATELINLAAGFERQGRLADAEPLYKRALAIQQKALGHDHPDVGILLNNLAVLYCQQGRYADADRLFKQSISIAEKALTPWHPQVIKTLNNLADLRASQRSYPDALGLLRRLIAQDAAEKTIALRILFETKSGDRRNFEESYHVVQQASSSSASKAISQLRARFAAGNDELAGFVRKEQDLAAEGERLNALLISSISKSGSERNITAESNIRNQIDDIQSQRHGLQQVFAARFPNYLALSKPVALTLEQTQSLLQEDEALVVFDFDDRSYAWIVTRDSFDWSELHITAEELNDDVERLRESLTFDVNKPFDLILSHRLYERTFGSLAKKSEGKKRLSVVSNGALTSLPLSLLVTKDPTGKRFNDIDWLVRSFVVTYLPSVSNLSVLRSDSPQVSGQKPMIAFADRVFSREPVSANARHTDGQRTALRSVVNFYKDGQPDLASLAKALSQLPDTADEVRNIGQGLNADVNDLKLGLSASETTVKKTDLRIYRIVYFATHALVAGEVEKFAKVKAEPALALTIPEKATELDDGLLTASEVAQLKLNAEWVVLSACNTAAEGTPGAEALSGLARAFFYAGARSHWEVDSEATVQLMTGMFQAIARNSKLSHAEALQQSMLAMIDGVKSDDDAHPRIWAPFVIVGEPAKGP